MKLTRGKAHPWKPRTPAQIKEFADLWHDPAMTTAKIAKRYRAATRTIQNWREDFGFGPKDMAVRLGAEARTIGDGAAAIVADMGEMGRVGQTILGAQASELQAQARAIETGDLRPINGVIVDPKKIKNWNPLEDAEVARLLKEIGDEARGISGHSDLAVLQRKLSRLSVLVATKMPVQTWETLQSTLETLSRSILWARKVEADIPPSAHDPILLRQEAGRQMMRELKSVLSEEDQQALAVIMKRGADKLTADPAKVVNGKTDAAIPGEATA